MQRMLSFKLLIVISGEEVEEELSSLISIRPYYLIILGKKGL